MKISFLIHNAYAIGGTITTTFNLARALAERHDVEVISALRSRERPSVVLDPRVRLRALVDLRHEKDDPRHRAPAKVFPAAENRYGEYSALTDERIGAALAGIDADVVVGTRPGLNVHLALQAPERVVRVGQEHLMLDQHSPRLRNALRKAYPRLDALTPVTEADAAVYRRKMRLPGVRLQALPNSVPAPTLPPADGRGRIVVAAGRLTPVKRFDLLIEAFAAVAAAHPDWTLRIYGRGEEKERLRALIDRLGLYESVFLMGAVTPMEAEWVKGSIGAVASAYESFGMTVVEAMSCGLPVVSTDCPYGPGEIISPGEDGLLVPVGDREALSGALLRLVADDELRRRMGRTARDNALRYRPDTVVAQAERLFEELSAARRDGRAAARTHDRALTTSGYAAGDTLLTAAGAVVRAARKVRR
ncbi:glycosyltransferase family 4 protein [Streptomyces sp. NBC_00525]|uniref:glycosyltransferase family 4 protein n=1 Tax=Streptomyces sp. NBC_00525 TaxID=2903660 RepID=UPI002E812B29|nr:glycosyltransferase family 4 protein [Streptomyces sp. NBC_00525]WUC95144.1 glycosyltransferase family 4 protein [Streptomyces sp. NBC_00525]